MDQLGQLLLVKKIVNDQEVDVSALKAGVYFLEINLGEEKVKKKLVVAH